MNFDWLKRYMPRGIYGRAALILVLPVVTLQLVVSVVFIQRHFEGVTLQLTNPLIHELQLVLEQIDLQETPVDALRGSNDFLKGLELKATFVGAADQSDMRRWFDFSGLIVTHQVKTQIPDTLAVQLPDDRVAKVLVNSKFGPVLFEFHRLRVSASNPHQLLVNMAFFGGLMTLIAFIYLRNQLRPITRLADAASAFGRGEKKAFNPTGASEIRAAGQAFVEMRARIEHQIEQRTLMLSGVSHDLRTPLTRLRLGLALLAEDERIPLERDVDDMQRMLDEFLTFAKGASEGQSENIEISEFLIDIVNKAARNGADVQYLSESARVELPVRPVALQRAIENLINNALRYGNCAEVSLALREDSISIRVEDRGPGIPIENREEALRPFSRLDEARNQNQGGGVGLGLSIAADAARAHGGQLILGESTRLGGLCAEIFLTR